LKKFKIIFPSNITARDVNNAYVNWVSANDNKDYVLVYNKCKNTRQPSISFLFWSSIQDSSCFPLLVFKSKMSFSYHHRLFILRAAAVFLLFAVFFIFLSWKFPALFEDFLEICDFFELPFSFFLLPPLSSFTHLLLAHCLHVHYFYFCPSCWRACSWIAW
jgi:hypothetical protein